MDDKKLSNLLRLLLIEDLEEDELLILSYLRRSDYEINHIRILTADEMKEALAHDEWDIILCDYNLPQFNAFTALTILKETGLDLPFIVVSGSIGEETAVALMRAGAQDYILKEKLSRLAPAVAREIREAQMRKERRQTEVALRKSESQYKSLFDGVPVGLYRCSLEGRLIEVNPSFVKLFGFKGHDQINMKNISELYIRRNDFEEWQRDIKDQGIIQRFETQMLRMDGNKIWVKGSASVVKDENGNPLYVEGNIEDFTEQRLVEEMARKLYRGIENATEMVLITDVDGRIEYVNPAFEQVSGYHFEEIKGKNPRFLKSEKQDSYFYEDLWGTILEGKVWSGSLINLKKSGEYYDEEMTIAPVSSDQGKVTNFVAIKRDVTGYKRLLSQIIQGRNEWEATFDAVSDMIVLTDENGIIIRHNQALNECFNSTFHEIIGLNIDRLFFGDSNIGSSISRLRGEIQFPVLNGWYDISSYPVYFKEQRQGVVYVIKDITARKQIEATLVASQKLADLGTLAAGIAHETNSPLQVIIGLSESNLKRLKQDQFDKERLVSNLETINRNGWRIADIVRSLLSYARASGEKLDQFDINDVVRETLLLIGHQLQVWSNINVVTDLGYDIPMFYCDKNKIEQVLINLLSNARDAMPSGGDITIHTHYDTQQEQIVLQVSDTGIGIPEEIRGKIFEPFFTTKPPGQGTGLGLSIVLGIVREHGGEIKVEQLPNIGTKFSLYFPLKPPSMIRPPTDEVG